MRVGRLASLAILVICYAVLPMLLPRETFQFTIVLSAGFAGLAVSLMLEAGLISFGHALFYGIGGYTVAALSQFAGLAGIALLLAGAAVGGLMALLTGLFVVRYRGVFFAMLNLAMAMVAYSTLLKSYTLTGGSDELVVAVSGTLWYTAWSRGIRIMAVLYQPGLCTTGWRCHTNLSAQPGRMGAGRDRGSRNPRRISWYLRQPGLVAGIRIVGNSWLGSAARSPRRRSGMSRLTRSTGPHRRNSWSSRCWAAAACWDRSWAQHSTNFSASRQHNISATAGRFCSVSSSFW